MAKQSKTDEISMEEYFNAGLADGSVEPNNPFEVAEQPAKHSGKRVKLKKEGGGKKRTFIGKRIIVLAVAAALLLAILGTMLLIMKRKNDGARYARKLSESIGMPLVNAKKNAGIETDTQSRFATLNQLYASFQAIAESRKTCRIQGVKLPEWAIFCNTSADELTNVTYYNYEVLEKNVFGTVRKSYQDPHLVSIGSTVEQVEDQLDLVPYRIQYLQGQTQRREYRYCYIDRETDDIVAYVITAIWDESGLLSNIEDSRKNYIGSLLASPDL